MKLNSNNGLSNKKIAFLFSIFFVVIFLLLLLVSLPSFESIPSTLDIEVTDIKGNQLKTSEFTGKIQIVEFFATWCVSCKEQASALSNLITKKNLAISDLVIWSISIDPVNDQPQILSSYIQQNHLTTFVDDGLWIVARDLDQVHQLYKVNTLPHIFIVDRSLTIKFNQVGLVTEDVLWQEINVLL